MTRVRSVKGAAIRALIACKAFWLSAPGVWAASFPGHHPQNMCGVWMTHEIHRTFVRLQDTPMKNSFHLMALAIAISATGLAQASDAETLLKESGCLSCHAKAEKIVGPAFLSIADKYRGDKDAVASLVQSIQNGSKGKWGRIPMPAHSSISQDDLKTLARHVLASKP